VSGGDARRLIVYAQAARIREEQVMNVDPFMVDPLSDPLGFDPLEQVERLIELPPLGSVLAPDPLAAMLGALERHIERPLAPELDIFADPLCKALDRVEASVEPAPVAAVEPDLPPGIVEPPGLDTGQVCVPPQPAPVDLDMPADNHDTVLHNGSSRSPRCGAPEQSRRSPAGNGRQRASRPRAGRSTGASRSGLYCDLHEQWITRHDCTQCPDYEEQADGEEILQQCVHADSD